jgi:ectoine hydroxylase-related dioxygenase (phytanoyl-CoA dioxygenase family)
VDVDAPYPLSAAEREAYARDGFVRLRGVFDAATLALYRPELAAKVGELNTLHRPMEERSTYEKAFLQVMNLWTKSELARRFVFGRRLARIAAELMDVRGVRLYHDQALYKEPGGGHTPWHADQYYWPLASDRCCTAWVPLQDTPLEMGPLAFSAGSHRVEVGRDLPISDESEAGMAAALDEAALPTVEEAFALGDVSFHSGWTFHRAGPNRTERTREVMTVIYMDAAMRLAAPRNRNQAIDRDTWCPGAAVGEVIETGQNPLLYP